MMSSAKDSVSSIFTDNPIASTINDVAPTLIADKGMEHIIQNPIDQVSTTTALQPNQQQIEDTQFTNEQPWNLSNIANKPLYIGDFNWTVAHSIGDLVASFDLIDAMLKVNGGTSRSNHLADLLARFTFCRFNIKVKVLGNTTMFDAGRLKFTALPFSPFGNNETAKYFMTPGVDFNAKESNNFELNIPWMLPVPYYPTNRTQFVKAFPPLNIHCLQKLIVKADTPTTHNFQIYVSLTNSVFKVPQQRNLNVPFYDSWYLTATQTTINDNNALITLTDRLAFDLTRNVVLQSMTTPNLTNTTGPSAELGFTNPGQLQISNVTENPLDEMDLNYITSHLSLIRRADITSSLARATRLMEVPVHPLVNPTETCPNRVTNLAYASNAFQFWSGDIGFLASFAKTKFTKGKIAITFVADDQFFPGLTDLEILSGEFYRQIFDVVDSSQYGFSIPFIHNLPVADMGDASTVPANAIGRLFFHIETPFVVSEPNAITSFNLFINAQTNFQLYEPRTPWPLQLVLPGTKFVPDLLTMQLVQANMRAVINTPPKKRIVKLQTLSDISSYQPDDYPPLFQVPNSTSGSSTATDLIPVKSIRTLIERPSFFYRLLFDQNNTYAEFLNSPDSTMIPTSFLVYFARMYGFWNGNLCYKIIADSSKLVEASFIIKYMAGYTKYIHARSTATGHPMMKFNLAQEPEVNFLIPYHTKYGALYTAQNDPIETSLPNDSPFLPMVSTGSFQIWREKNAGVTTQTILADMFHYAGPNFTFGGFRGANSDIANDFMFTANNILTGRQDLDHRMGQHMFDHFRRLTTAQLVGRYPNYRAANTSWPSNLFYADTTDPYTPVPHMGAEIWQTSPVDPNPPIEWIIPDLAITLSHPGAGPVYLMSPDTATNLDFPIIPEALYAIAPSLVFTVDTIEYTCDQIRVRTTGLTMSVNPAPTDTGVFNTTLPSGTYNMVFINDLTDEEYLDLPKSVCTSLLC